MVRSYCSMSRHACMLLLLRSCCYYCCVHAWMDRDGPGMHELACMLQLQLLQLLLLLRACVRARLPAWSTRFGI